MKSNHSSSALGSGFGVFGLVGVLIALVVVLLLVARSWQSTEAAGITFENNDGVVTIEGKVLDDMEESTNEHTAAIEEALREAN